MKPLVVSEANLKVFAKIILWCAIITTGLGCGYFIYDNVVFLLNFSTWVPDREINLKTSLGMLTASLINLFNLVWLILVLVTRRPPARLMKPILAISGALSLIFAVSLVGLILFSLNANPPGWPTLLIALYAGAVILMVVRLFQLAIREIGKSFDRD